MPVKTSAIEIYKPVQIKSELIMPRGISFCGFLHSSAIVEIASNPM